MTAPMTMNRLIHAAVRRDLGRLTSALDEVAEGDRSRAGELQRAFANLRQELTHHHEGEDTHIWPVLPTFGVGPDLISAMESEHEAMAAALGETDAAMSTFARSASAADAAAARASVVHTHDVVERHLVHEETELEPYLIRHEKSPEWKAAEKKLSRQPPGVAGRFFAWLTDGMTDDHRAFLKKTVPTPVVTVLAKVFGRRYNREVAPVWTTRPK
jgi:hemerythrin-like domain-containing protein